MGAFLLRSDVFLIVVLVVLTCGCNGTDVASVSVGGGCLYCGSLVTASPYVEKSFISVGSINCSGIIGR